MADHDFIFEPVESDIIVKAPIYYDEPGKKRGKASPVTLTPCKQCGTMTIEGQLTNGEIITVEPDSMMYTIVWRSGEKYPSLLESRGYPRHVCRVDA